MNILVYSWRDLEQSTYERASTKKPLLIHAYHTLITQLSALTHARWHVAILRERGVCRKDGVLVFPEVLIIFQTSPQLERTPVNYGPSCYL